MVWTPFGKSTTSTSQDQVDPNLDYFPPSPSNIQDNPVMQHTNPMPQAETQPLPMQDQPMPQGQAGADENWYNESNFEGQLAVDVYQTETDIVIKAPIAGVSPSEIDIAITDDVVTIKGHRQMMDNISAEDYYCQECYYGVFSRSIILPVPVMTEQAAATFLNGVLTITISKAANARTKKLEVKAL